MLQTHVHHLKEKKEKILWDLHIGSINAVVDLPIINPIVMEAFKKAVFFGKDLGLHNVILKGRILKIVHALQKEQGRNYMRACFPKFF